MTAVPLATTNTAVLHRSPASAVAAGRLAPVAVARRTRTRGYSGAAAPAAPAAPMPVSGRYRVVANGFTVIHESFDDSCRATEIR